MDLEAKSSCVLLYFVHGNNGTAEDWKFVIPKAQEQLPNVFIKASSCNEGSKTLKGVEALANDLISEIVDYTSNALSNFAEIHLYFVSHSLGGLVVRYSLPGLVQAIPKIRLYGYCSIASPHIGVLRHGGSLIKAAWKGSIESVCKNLFQQTGLDLALKSEAHDHGNTLFLILS